MCSGPRKPNPPPIHEEPLKPQQNPSMLVEFAACNDLLSLKEAVEVDNWSLDATAPWYCRSFGPGPKMGFADRTPLMIAALYGSVDVINYIIASSNQTFDVNRKSDFDGATALHLAAAGGSPNSMETVNILIGAAADVDAVDNSGRRPGDVIAKQTSKLLEVVLKAATASPRVSSPVTPRESWDEKKKEYPPDLTLPDIKNGIYGTDEFRMYTFKVRPCSRAYSHDWTECPFVHPGENARRRDPRKYLYSCVPCPEFRKGSCRNGDNCEYAHGVFECWLHPAQYRTRLCKDVAECNRRVCFFAHRVEELRSVNPTAASVNGLGVPSPRSAGISNLDLAAAAMMMSQSPMSSSAAAVSAGMGSPGVWMNQAPTLQLPSSRLKSSMSARDLDVDFELLGLEGFQQKLFGEIQGAAAAASPRANWASTTPLAAAAAAAAASRAADYSNLFGSQLANQSLTQQLLSGYNNYNGNSIQSSPTLNSSSSFGLDHSMAKAIMNSRSAAFANRSQSFCDRGAVARLPSGLTASPAASTTTTNSMGLTDWGSPDGKVDWGIQGEELNKFRKSASFAYRNNQALSPPRAASAAPFEEPDLSWVQSLVKDGPANGPVVQQKSFSPWGEEQMVA